MEEFICVYTRKNILFLREKLKDFFFENFVVKQWMGGSFQIEKKGQG